MKIKRLLIALLCLTPPLTAGAADFRFGLGSAVAHRSAQLINAAGTAPNQGNSCGGQSTGKSGAIQFTLAPIDVGNVTFLQSLGNLNPPGHTFPTDHVYFYYTTLGFTQNQNPITNPNQGECSGGCPVYALADGFISEIMTGIENNAVQYKVIFTYTDTFSSYYDHMMALDPSISNRVGKLPSSGNTCTWIPIKTGQVVGTVGGVSGENALDLGVLNTQITQPFITPSHYGPGVNSDSPYKYFAEPLRTTLYGMIGRSTPDYTGSNEKDGIFCYDVANTIQGNWAAQGSDSYWENPDSWPQQLSIGYDPVYASQIRITFGGFNGQKSFGLLGYWMVQSGATPPASVTVATGAYGYQIYGWDPSYGTIDLDSGPNGALGPHGLLMLQLLDNNTMKAEYFAGTDPSVTTLPFDSNAVMYTR